MVYLGSVLGSLLSTLFLFSLLPQSAILSAELK